jgi:hypothetical protein
MRHLIRYNAFETNSSSTHSLTINFNLDYSLKNKYKDKEVVFKSKDYPAYSKAKNIEEIEEKVSYLLAGIADTWQDENKRLKKHALLKKALKTFLDCKTISFVPVRENDWGSFQDLSGDTIPQIFETDGTLKYFLFSNVSRVEIK